MHISQTKGRPKEGKGKGKISNNGRLKSCSIEVSSSWKKQTHSICGLQGHDKRNCGQHLNREMQMSSQVCIS